MIEFEDSVGRCMNEYYFMFIKAGLAAKDISLCGNNPVVVGKMQTWRSR